MAATTNGISSRSEGEGEVGEVGGRGQEGKERLESGWGGCRSEGSQAVEQVKAKTTDDSPIRMLAKADLANQSLISISSLDGTTFLLSSPAHYCQHHFMFFYIGLGDFSISIQDYDKILINFDQR